MVGYPNSLLSVPSFCDNQQSTWRDIPLEGLHTGTTPTLVQCTKVSYNVWLGLWYSVVVTSCTKMMCVWRDRGPLVSTNTACLTFRLQFRTTANTLNSWYIVSWYSYRWIWPEVPYLMIHGRIPQFTISGAVILWQPTIHLEGRTTGGFTHRNHSSTDAMY
jgi:hypothetical protein